MTTHPPWTKEACHECGTVFQATRQDPLTADRLLCEECSSFEKGVMSAQKEIEALKTTIAAMQEERLAKAVKLTPGANKHETARAFVLRERGCRVWQPPLPGWPIHAPGTDGRQQCAFFPDLMVVDEDGTIAFEDIKANWGSKKRPKAGAKDDAIVKIKACARLYPLFRWRQVMPADPKALYGEWVEKEFGHVPKEVT